MCSSELVLLARSAAVVAANLASLEPSVARRTLVGNILTGLTTLFYVPSLGVMMPQAEVQRSRPESIHPSARKVNSAKLTFRFTEFSDVHLEGCARRDKLQAPRSATKKVTTRSRSQATTAARPTSTSTATSKSSTRRPTTKAPTTRTNQTTISIQAVLEGAGRNCPGPFSCLQ